MDLFKRKFFLALLAGLLLTATSGTHGQEPRDRAGRPPRVGEPSSIRNERIMKPKPMVALEAARQKNGPVKAMLFLDNNGHIVRCFNSLNDEATNSQPPCGFAIERSSTTTGLSINFGFQVNDRFVLTTPVITGGRFQPEAAQPTTAPIAFDSKNSNAILVLSSRPETPLMIFVF